MVAAEGIEPTSLDYRSSALPLSYTAMVDPTGLKPAPHGLKGRCSVTRAPGQETGCGGRTRTFDIRINNPAPYQLGYATKFGGPEGIQTLTRSLQDFYALCYITSPIWWLRVELNHQPSDYETLALSPLSYAAVK